MTSIPATNRLENLWDDARATQMSEAEKLLYRSNLLGSDKRVTNYGGGNTSAKVMERDPLTGQMVQVLWVNMVSSVALAMSLAFEPTEPGVMARPPRPRHESLLNGFLLWRIVFVSALFLTGIFAMYGWAISRGYPLELARTLAVNTLVVMEVFYLFAVRYLDSPSITLRGVMGTPVVLMSVALVVMLQLLFTYAPFMHRFFASHPVSLVDGMRVIAVGAGVLLVLEIEKRVRQGLLSIWRQQSPTE